MARMTLDTLILRAFRQDNPEARKALGDCVMTEIDYEILLWRVGYNPKFVETRKPPFLHREHWTEEDRQRAGVYSETLNL